VPIPVIALLVLAAAATARAQDAVFDPAVHLEGFEERALAPNADVYDLARWKREAGKSVSAARLEELRVLWRADRERGDARKAKIEQDPRQLALFKNELKLRRDPFFKSLSWTIDDSKLPYAFLLHESTTDERLLRQTAQRVLAALENAERRITQDVLVPAGATEPGAARLHTVMVLGGSAHYDKCVQVHHSVGFYTLNEACWLRAFDTLVVFHDSSLTGAQAQDALRSAQLEFTVARLRKACAAPSGWRAWWLLVALAAHGSRSGLSDVPADAFRDAWVKALVKKLTDPSRRPLVAPLAELAAIPDPQFDRIAEQARARGAQGTSGSDVASAALRTFYEQAALWGAFLVTHKRAELTRCVHKALQGATGTDTLHEGFAAGDLPALETAFAAWLRSEHHKLAPEIALPDPLPLPLTRPAAPASEAAAAAAPASTASAQPAASATPTAASLAPTAAEWQLALAQAVSDSRRGALRRAEQTLAALQAQISDAAARERVQRTLTRLTALLDVRKRLLAQFADGKKVLDLDFGDKRVRGRVETLTDTHVAVRAGKDLHEVDLDTFLPAKLDVAARRLGVLAVNSWESVYLQMLAEGASEKWKRKLTGTLAPSQELAGDVDSYVELTPLLEPARLLAALTAGLEGQPALDAITTLVRAHAALPEVDRRRASLRERARALLAHTFDPYTAAGLGVHAKVERVDEGKVRVTYGCQDAAELGDFTPDADCMKTWKMEGDPGGEPRITSAKTGFAASGRGALRLPFAAASPLRAEWVSVYPSANSYLYLGLCDDGGFANILVHNDGTVFVTARDVPPKGVSKVRTFVDSPAKTELVHDGKKVSTRVDGVEAATDVAVGDRTRGGVFLFTVGPGPCTLQSLRLEWTLDPPLLESLRQQYVTRRVREIFAGE
jgi:hypothetical protein